MHCSIVLKFSSTVACVARAALGARAPPGRRNFYGVIYREKLAVHTPGRVRSNFFRGHFFAVGMVNFAVLACVLRATTKKWSSTFSRKKMHPQRKSWLRPCLVDWCIMGTLLSREQLAVRAATSKNIVNRYLFYLLLY